MNPAQDASDLTFLDEGAGDPTLVFLHGMGGDARFSFAPQIEHFRRFRRVISIDLPGHGKSPALESLACFEALYRRVARRVATLVPGAPFLVGHSLGGMVALRMADAVARPRGVVLLDVPILMPAAVERGMEALVDALGGPAWQAGLRAFAVENLCGPTTPQWLCDGIVERLERLGPSTVTRLVQAMGGFDAESALRRLAVPALYVHSSAPADLARIAALAPSLRIEELPAAGHYCQLERSAQVNALLDAFIGAHDGSIPEMR